MFFLCLGFKVWVRARVGIRVRVWVSIRLRAILALAAK